MEGLGVAAVWALLTGGALFNPAGIGLIDVLERYSVNGWKLVRVKRSNGALDGFVSPSSGLEQESELSVILHRSLPGIEALDLGDLGAGDQLTLDQRSSNLSSFCQAANSGVDGDELHKCYPQ